MTLSFLVVIRPGGIVDCVDSTPFQHIAHEQFGLGLVRRRKPEKNRRRGDDAQERAKHNSSICV